MSGVVLKRQELRHILMRIALAFVFISIGIWEIVQPSYWSFYIPEFLTVLASATTLTMFHGAVMLILGIAVLLGIRLKVSAGLCSIMMIAIIGDLIAAFGFNDIVIRDIAILLLAVAIYLDDVKYLRLIV